MTVHVSFISDSWWGQEPGWDHLFSKQLLAQFAEVDFDFRFFQITDFADKELHSLQMKKLIAHNSQHIVCAIDQPPMNDTFKDFLGLLPKKSHGDIWMLEVPLLLYGSDAHAHEKLKEDHQKMAAFCASDKLHWIDPSDYFQNYINLQIEKNGNLHALHKGKGELTLLGQLLLSEFVRMHLQGGL